MKGKSSIIRRLAHTDQIETIGEITSHHQGLMIDKAKCDKDISEYIRKNLKRLRSNHAGKWVVLQTGSPVKELYHNENFEAAHQYVIKLAAKGIDKQQSDPCYLYQVPLLEEVSKEGQKPEKKGIFIEFLQWKDKK